MSLTSLLQFQPANGAAVGAAPLAGGVGACGAASHLLIHGVQCRHQLLTAFTPGDIRFDVEQRELFA